ncbi:IDEAL domain-containing protein [Mesobacillus foraminis]|uniref:IDEAL domain-containing protein n=1 Tax=Mesobacillus foraminis TaxID=279826 RepID=UPI001BEBC559|nr:IDEAL domain-containing protein [Mesobacillus foraminis]MBT2757746.1 IDEAL domain-containing protein [Mesobacillus foraminis]
MENNDFLLKTGDWVKGRSRDGELIIGYTESINNSDGVVAVHVVTSDNEESIGRTVQLLAKRVKKLPDSKIPNKEQISFLIDLALSTGDEEWFLELSSQLKSMRKLMKEAIY